MCVSMLTGCDVFYQQTELETIWAKIMMARKFCFTQEYFSLNLRVDTTVRIWGSLFGREVYHYFLSNFTPLFPRKTGPDR